MEPIWTNVCEALEETLRLYKINDRFGLLVTSKEAPVRWFRIEVDVVEYFLGEDWEMYGGCHEYLSEEEKDLLQDILDDLDFNDFIKVSFDD